MITRRLRNGEELGYGWAVFFNDEYGWPIGMFCSVHISHACERRQFTETLLDGGAIGIDGYRSMRSAANIQCRNARHIAGRRNSDRQG